MRRRKKNDGARTHQLKADRRSELGGTPPAYASIKIYARATANGDDFARAGDSGSVEPAAPFIRLAGVQPFLIYLDPQHGTNNVHTLVISQMTAAVVGFVTFLVLGPGYFAAGGAMVFTIVLMILFDVVHPPAVATTLGFAFRSGSENNLLLFGVAVGITGLLVY